MPKEINIIKDTREQEGWTFDNMTIAKLDTGDYTIDGYDKIVCIERKKSAAELAANISQARFWKEMARMEKFDYKFLVCEFPLLDLLKFPHLPTIPYGVIKKIKVKGPYVMKRVSEISVDYGVHVVFCDNAACAQTYVKKLFYRIVERENE